MRLLVVFCLMRLKAATSIPEKSLVKETGRYPDNTDMMRKIRKVSGVDTTDGEPLTVNVGMYIESLSSFKTTDMSFDLDLYFRIIWRDERWSHNNTQPMLFVKEEEIKDFWIPDLYFANSKKSWFQHLLTPNKFIRIYSNGETHMSVRVTLTAACNQDLRFYPHDQQKCGIMIRSYSHPTTRMQLRWVNRAPIQSNAGLKLPELAIVGFEPEDCQSEYTYAETNSFYMRANFSCLFGAIRLKRELGYHMVQTYVPTALIVVISWVSFFIDPAAVPARVSLSFTTLLTLSTMAAGVRVSLPPVAYAKAIDIWVGVCMFFVFASLLEFAVVNSFVRDATSLQSLKELAEIKKEKLVRKYKLHEHDDTALLQKRIECLATSKNSAARRVDLFCRVIFPATFGLFNIAYWVYYTRASS